MEVKKIIAITQAKLSPALQGPWNRVRTLSLAFGAPQGPIPMGSREDKAQMDFKSPIPAPAPAPSQLTWHSTCTGFFPVYLMLSTRSDTEQLAARKV